MITAIHKSLAVKRDRLDRDEKGFTLIELLVVILIIGILAAIAIPVFLGQQNSAKNAAAVSDLANAKIALIAYSTDNNGTFPAPVSPATWATVLKSYGYTKTDGTSGFTVAAASDGTFCITEVSSTTTAYAVSDANSPAKGTCTGTVFTAAS